MSKRATTGNIVDTEKIKKYCPDCDVDEIKKILDCFVDEGMLVKTNTYLCRNGHYFVPKKIDFNEGYDCFECAKEDIGEDERFIDQEELEDCFVASTYRISNKADIDIFQAKAYMLAGDLENAIKIALKAYKDIEKENATKEGAMEKIKEWLPVASGGTIVADKISTLVSAIF